LIEAHVATSAGIAWAEDPAGTQWQEDWSHVPRKASTVAEINRLLWLLFLNGPDALCQVFIFRQIIYTLYLFYVNLLDRFNLLH